MNGKKRILSLFQFLSGNWLFLSILLVGAILRTYKIREYLVFLGDEGRDVLVLKRMFINHEFTLLGPITSVGGMYLGPAYYYFIAPFFWFFGFDPVGPAIMVALVGVATIFLVYRVGSEFFSRATGLWAALFYATSPLVITYSRSSWNPNVLPFFSLLVIYGLLKVVVKKQWNWLFVASFSIGIALQLHYLALMFIVIYGFILLYLRKDLTVKRLVLAISGSFISFSPFIFFEVRHQFPNTQTIWHFLNQSGQSATLGFSNIFGRFIDYSQRIFASLLAGQKLPFTGILILFIAASLAIYIFRKRQEKTSLKALNVILLWLGVGTGVYSIYRGVVYDYYFTPVFPAPFLILGIVFAQLAQKKVWGKVIVTVLSIGLIFMHFSNSPHKYGPNDQVTQTENIARFILGKTEGKPYNLALISSGNSDHAYRFFLEMWGYPPTTIENKEVDPKRQSVTDQLLIVCEDKICQPLGHSLWEIAGFGAAEVAGVWEVFPVKIIRLVSYRS